MSQGNKLKFQRGAAANREFEDRSKGAENRHHVRDDRPARENLQSFSALWRFEQGRRITRTESPLLIPIGITRPRDNLYDADQQRSRLPVNSSRTDCTDFARPDWSCSCIVRARVADWSEIEMEKLKSIQGFHGGRCRD